MFTPAQVAQTLTVPPSTLRRWAKRFAPFLSPQSGKKRTYTVADLDAFQRIKDLSAQGYTFAQIDQALTVIDQPPANSALVNLADFAQALESARGQLIAMQAQIDQQANELNAIKEWLRLPFYKRVGKKPPI